MIGRRLICALLFCFAGGASGFAQTPPDDPSVQCAQPVETQDNIGMTDFEVAAMSRGTPDFPGLNIVWLTPWINPALARDWRNIVVHQSESGPGSAWRNAVSQMQKPARRGATIWVDTDGTVYWAVAEFAAPVHIRDGNRIDSRFVDNRATHARISNRDSLGIEFVGNYPNVRKRPTDAQVRAWGVLLRILQVRYGVPNERVFAHNWIDYKDRRYCEGCELAAIARTPPPDIPLVLATHP